MIVNRRTVLGLLGAGLSYLLPGQTSAREKTSFTRPTPFDIQQQSFTVSRFSEPVNFLKVGDLVSIESSLVEATGRVISVSDTNGATIKVEGESEKIEHIPTPIGNWGSLPTKVTIISRPCIL